MSSVEIVEESKYYSVNDTLEYSKCDDFNKIEEIPNVKFLIRIDITNRYRQNNWDGIRRNNWSGKINLFDETGSVITELQENLWKFSINNYTYLNSWNTYDDSVCLKFTDALGKVYIQGKIRVDIYAILIAYKLFLELSKHSDYTYSMQAMEIERIKVENSRLLSEISELKNRIK